MYGAYRDAQLQFNSSTETSTDHNTEPSLDIESMYQGGNQNYQHLFKSCILMYSKKGQNS